MIFFRISFTALETWYQRNERTKELRQNINIGLLSKCNEYHNFQYIYWTVLFSDHEPKSYYFNKFIYYNLESFNMNIYADIQKIMDGCFIFPHAQIESVIYFRKPVLNDELKLKIPPHHINF